MSASHGAVRVSRRCLSSPVSLIIGRFRNWIIVVVVVERWCGRPVISRAAAARGLDTPRRVSCWEQYADTKYRQGWTAPFRGGIYRSSFADLSSTDSVLSDARPVLHVWWPSNLVEGERETCPTRPLINPFLLWRDGRRLACQREIYRRSLVTPYLTP